MIALTGVAIGSSASLDNRFGWTAFVSIYAAVHSALLLLSRWVGFEAWRAGRAAKRAAAAAEEEGDGEREEAARQAA